MKYLVDINLHKYFIFFNHPDFSFVSDIGLQLSDTQIWDHALKNGLIILTKDTDFFSRSILLKGKVKVIHFKIGNKTLSYLHKYFTQNWDVISTKISENNLVVCFQDRIEIVL